MKLEKEGEEVVDPLDASLRRKLLESTSHWRQWSSHQSSNNGITYARSSAA